jgi:NADH dehydrogenase (ubiquinone) Fe-S protein 1
LKYESINALRERMSEIAPNLTRYGDVEEANYFKQAQTLAQVTGSAFAFRSCLQNLVTFNMAEQYNAVMPNTCSLL